MVFYFYKECEGNYYDTLMIKKSKWKPDFLSYFSTIR